MMHRIFFDENDGTDDWGYSLNFRDSLQDIAAIGDDIHDGMHVIIYMPNEFEMEAVLQFDKSVGYWKAMPVKGTVKYLDKD